MTDDVMEDYLRYSKPVEVRVIDVFDMDGTMTISMFHEIQQFLQRPPWPVKCVLIRCGKWHPVGERRRE